MCVGIENGNSAKKRRRNHNNNTFEDIEEEQSCNENSIFAPQNSLETSSFRRCCKRFLTILSNEHVYESEVCKPKGETMYIELRDSVLLNVQNIEYRISNNSRSIRALSSSLTSHRGLLRSYKVGFGSFEYGILLFSVNFGNSFMFESGLHLPQEAQPKH